MTRELINTRTRNNVLYKSLYVSSHVRVLPFLPLKGFTPEKALTAKICAFTHSTRSSAFYYKWVFMLFRGLYFFFFFGNIFVTVSLWNSGYSPRGEHGSDNVAPTQDIGGIGPFWWWRKPECPEETTDTWSALKIPLYGATYLVPRAGIEPTPRTDIGYRSVSQTREPLGHHVLTVIHRFHSNPVWYLFVPARVVSWQGILAPTALARTSAGPVPIIQHSPHLDR
jgi:hypothetical protein